ncbi:acyltransferase domain-containing protein [Streptomyces lunalinharesii]|uniref:[acyl-carrier-protein] S-malonyltransferase n=1 Tax=Streptomyces lunalinharesii TaxID=333384 RepID=A0ABP6DZB2_9ACTN
MAIEAFVFPGQGVQRAGFGRALFDRFPDLEAEADDVLRYRIRTLCLDDPEHLLTESAYAQPAVFVVNALLLQAALEEGPAPQVVLGHSLGEYNALYAAGVLSFREALVLVRARGVAFSRVSGVMLAVVGPTSTEIQKLLDGAGSDRAVIANYNSARQHVLAGTAKAITAARSLLEAAGAQLTARLRVSAPAHSPLMAPAAEDFAPHVARVPLGPLRIPVISNRTARPHRSDELRQVLVDHLTHPVLWQLSVEGLWGTYGGPDSVRFTEIGPDRTLTKLITHIRRDYAAARTPTARETMMEPFTLTQLSVVLRTVTNNETLPDLDNDRLDTPMEALGVDSMQLVDLSRRLNTAYGLPPAPDLLADFATPRLVLDYVHSNRVVS